VGGENEAAVAAVLAIEWFCGRDRIDGSVIETFVDRREALTLRLYDVPAEEGDIRVKWMGAVDMLKALIVSSVKPISEDRPTM